MTALASPELCAFVRKQAPPHYATPNAPSTWPALREWFRASRTYECGSETTCFPVFDGGCDSTIYPDAATNYAFRAWHDSIHLYHGLDFSRASEIKVGLIHAKQARVAGLSKRDIAMLVANTVGQSEYYHERGCYVNDQALFVAIVLEYGLRAVLDSEQVY